MLAVSANALSLGASRGQVVIGSPVDVTFEFQPDAGSDFAGSCVTAQVVAGDAPLGDARVRVSSLSASSAGRPSVIRVQTTVVVDEPVVSVTLSAGCTGKTTRTYTFLSELPVPAGRSVVPVDVARLSQAAVPTPLPTSAASAAAPAPAVAPAVTAPAGRATGRPAAESAVRPPAPQPSARPPKQKAAVPPVAARPPTPRLVVEPLEAWLESPVLLRSAPSLAITPLDEPSAQRAQAAALWKSLNAQPGDVDGDAERAKVLEADLSALKTQAARDRATAAQLQEKLTQAESDRFEAPFVYGLGALAALALAIAGWAVWRLRQASDRMVRSWHDSVELGSREDVQSQAAALGLVPDPADSWLPPDTQPGSVSRSAHADLVATTAPAPGLAIAPVPMDFERPPAAIVAPTPVPAPPPVPVVAPSPVESLYIVNPEELFDIQQQAEFFVSVGEHQQAIEVLKNHIADHRKTSPLAYLELLRLYHTLSRVDEFSRLREQFMQSFNAQVPAFAAFNRTGRTLYQYTDALAEIEAQWTSASVLELLESYLFRDERGSDIPPFDLAAYDDLLLLLSIAQTTPASVRGAPPPRHRTTPTTPVRSDSAVFDGSIPPVSATAAVREEAPDYLLAGGIDFDFDSMPGGLGLEKPTEKPFSVDSLAVPLDLDLSDAPGPLTLADLPPLPVTAPPAAGQPVGFGLDNELMELRLELEQRKNNGQG